MRDELKEELRDLRAKVVALQTQARGLRERAERLDAPGRRRRHAVVDRSRCTGCGLCGQLCPVGAIRVTYVANIDAGRCTGCGVCAQSCPQDAIRLSGAAAVPAAESADD